MGLREPTNFITTGPLGNSQRPEEFSQRFFGLEPFVDADVAAEFLLVKRKTILDWARGRVLFQRTRMGGESESCGVSESRKSLSTRDDPEHNGRRQSRDGQNGREVWLELRAKAGSEPETEQRPIRSLLLLLPRSRKWGTEGKISQAWASYPSFPTRRAGGQSGQARTCEDH
jgi:hypothetical protein